MMRMISRTLALTGLIAALVVGIFIGLPSQTTLAANCDGLPVTGDVIPDGTYTMTDDCVVSATFSIAGDTTVTINGGGFSISGGGTQSVFFVNSGGTLNLNNLTVANGFSSSVGGGILSFGTVTITNSAFSDNSADSGGGIAIGFGGEATITNSTFFDNNAEFGGGGIFSGNFVFAGPSSGPSVGVFNDATVMVVNSTFFSNSAQFGGGGIYNASMLTVTGSNFSGNSADSGGGIFNPSTARVTDSTFTGNIAGDGGGIHNLGTLEVANSVFSGNTVNSGGGIANGFDGMMTSTNSTFSGNSASNLGGGIINNGSLIINGDTFSANHADDFGGAIASFNAATDVATITCSHIENNITGAIGLDVHHFSGGPLIMENNWWGAATGPNTPGADTTNVSVSAWLTAPAAPCGTPSVGTASAPTAPQLPPPPMCNVVNSAEIDAYDLPDGFYCRVLMRNGAWQVHAGGVPQGLIDNYVILAIDVFHLSGQQVNNNFGGHIPVCLQGEGRLIFLDATTSPRALIELETFAADGTTCGWIPNAGTLVLIRGD
jgi:hypothetical protein